MFELIRNFLWWSAGLGVAERDLLEHHGLDHSKYGSIGFAVLGTGVLALATGGTAAYAVSDNMAIAVTFALFWAALIFNLDRLAVSLPGEPDLFDALFRALPRIFLAALIGLVIAVPLELKIFEREIVVQMAADRVTHRNRIDRSLAPLANQRDQLVSENNGERQALAAERGRVQSLEQAAVVEADGSGGTGERGAGAIYIIKRHRADTARQDYLRRIVEAKSRIEVRNRAIARLEAEIAAAREHAMLAHGRATGLLARIEALGRKADADWSVWGASWLVTLLVMALEVAPVLMKAFFGRSLYDLARAQIVEGHRIRMGYELNAWDNHCSKEVTLSEIGNRREIAQALVSPLHDPNSEPTFVPCRPSDSHK